MEFEEIGLVDSFFIVIFGPPASGKTTLANTIIESIEKDSFGAKQQTTYCLISADCC